MLVYRPADPKVSQNGKKIKVKNDSFFISADRTIPSLHVVKPVNENEITAVMRQLPLVRETGTKQSVSVQ